MNRWSTCFAFAGLAIMVSGCAYYPNGPYGPGYGPYRPGYDQPPPQEGNGPPPPPPQEGYPPPQQQGYAPQGQYSGPPGQGAAQEPTQAQIAKMNDPDWCSKHPHKCQKLRSEYGQPQQGPGNQPPSPPQDQ
jgi:hypothetical protein